MEVFLSILVAICGIVSFVLWILVLVRAFKSGATVWGVLGIFIPLVAFIWGWMNAKKENLMTIMLIWTAAVVLVIILYAILAATLAATLSTYGMVLPLLAA